MPARRTVAPDIVGCSFLLYAATLSFAVLRAPYAHRSVSAVATDIAIYGGLLLACVAIAMGLVRRRGWVLGPTRLLSLATLATGLAAWHVPETAQLPAGVLGATGVVLLLGRRSELGDADPDADAHADGKAEGERAAAQD